VDQGRGEHLWGAQATAPAASWRRMCWRRLVQTSAVRGPVVCTGGPHAQPLLRAGNRQRQPERNTMPAHDQLLQQAVRGDPC